MTDFERLDTTGFLFEGTSVRGFNLMGNYGDGYREGVVTGHPEGLRKWKVKINALPDSDDYMVNAGVYGMQTRAEYLWQFYVRHNVRAAFKPFWVRDPKTRQDFLAEIVDEELDYGMLCAIAYSTGLTLRQRRVRGVASVGDPITAENNAEI